jgi:hypothetical protein
MSQKLRRLLIALSSLVGFWVTNSSVNAGDFFRFSLGIRGCLAIEGAEGSKPGELRIVDPCRTTPDALVEVASSSPFQTILIIHASKQEFRCLGITLPPIGEPVPLPQKVMPNCALNTQWDVGQPKPVGERLIRVHSEGTHAMCLQTRRGPTGNTEVIVDSCVGAEKWTLEPVPAPDLR